jgi:hypothetical protein
LIGLLLSPDNGGRILPRNLDKLPPEHTILRSRK